MWRECLEEVGSGHSCKEGYSVYHNGFNTGGVLMNELVSEKGHILNVSLEDLNMNKDFIDE